ncbi:MAG: penicillin acylase, partial [Halieaceae bacterium]|nr:penicillin acylase [Halieaceae bacterium]
DFNTEIENAQILTALAQQHGTQTATDIFDDLNPRRTTGAPTTIAADDWSASNIEATAHSLPTIASSDPVLDNPGTAARMSGFSNCIVLGPTKANDANAILVNGPQFGWFVPAYTYSVGLHGAGFNIVGNTPFAYPVILFGHNADIAWGSTWGAGDIVDIYREQLNPDNTAQYMFKGSYRDFQTRTETIKIKGAADKIIEMHHSVHGPVTAFDKQNLAAYAKHRSWDGKELISLLAWMHSGRASNPQQWLAYAEQPALNINWYYADRAGNIGYAFVGHYPQRVDGHDNRYPADGTGAMEWQGRQPFTNNPHVIDPASGYIANWNNKPAEGVLNPDEHWYSWSSADRVENLKDTIESQDRFSPEQAWNIIESSSFADVNAKYFLQLIRQAAPQWNDPRLQQAGALLENWDGSSRDRDADGFYDQAQTLLFQTFLDQLLKDVLADDLGPAFKWFSSTGYPSPGRPTPSGLNISTGLKTLVEALKGSTRYDFLNGQDVPSQLGAALLTAVSRISDVRGEDPARWRMPVAPRPYSSKNFLGIPQADVSSEMVAPIEHNRGTENNMMVMTADKVIGYEVVPPGQSGFISPAGEKHQHYEDQFDLYNTFGKRRIWFYPQDVEAHKVSETVITLP